MCVYVRGVEGRRGRGKDKEGIEREESCEFLCAFKKRMGCEMCVCASACGCLCSVRVGPVCINVLARARW